MTYEDEWDEVVDEELLYEACLCCDGDEPCVWCESTGLVPHECSPDPD